jgi:DNA-binding transcriptional ArsR family regulator
MKLDVMSDHMNTIFAALSDPTRRSVVEQLVRGQKSVSELFEPFEMALPTFLKHLRVLEDCGLIVTVKRGRVRTCQIAMGPILEVQGWLTWQTTIRESVD